jgi:hypothetical protein
MVHVYIYIYISLHHEQAIGLASLLLSQTMCIHLVGDSNTKCTHLGGAHPMVCIVLSLSYVVPWRHVSVWYFILRECYFTHNVI